MHASQVKSNHLYFIHISSSDEVSKNLGLGMACRAVTWWDEDGDNWWICRERWGGEWGDGK
ncbi:hypothetical protein BDR22DRAFT_844121 [Usnea florida]